MSASEHVARPEGELDIALIPPLADAWLRASEEQQPARFVIDLAAVTFLDSSALSAIVAVNRQQRDHGGELVVINVPARLAKVFRLTGLDGFLGLADETWSQDEDAGPGTAAKGVEAELLPCRLPAKVANSR